jgi:precorrin-6A synthase
MRKLLVVGIGAGDPEYLTIQAINALKRVNVFFLLDKGPDAAELAEMRRQICERYLPDQRYRTVTISDPPRDRAATDYPGAVVQWRDERARRLEQAITAELDEDGGCGGFLVWGDPALYDGTIRIIESIRERSDIEIDYEVIPGISSIQALAARHRLTLNRVAGSIHVTTGRRLAEGLPSDAEDVVVMLDSQLTCASLRHEDLDIYWGAYLGTADEALISGRLRDVIDDIADARRELRQRKGWIMDTYLLRRVVPENEAQRLS